MESKEIKNQYSKILQWMEHINKQFVDVKKEIKDLKDMHRQLERKMDLRDGVVDERLDQLFEAVESLLKAIKRLRVEQYNDRSHFQDEIQKLKQEIKTLMN